MADDHQRPDPRESTAGTDEDETYRSSRATPLDRRGPWSAEFAEDLARYRAHYDGSLLKPLLLEQALWALLQYRLASAVHRSDLPYLLKAPLLLAAVLGHKLVEVVTGISLPYRADLMPGIYIGHFGPLVVNAGARIGAGCNLSHGVTIGVSGRGARRGAPVIGERVYIGAGTVVAGRITIGDDAVLAANSLVNRDVEAHTTVVGVPAAHASSAGTPGMGLHMRRASSR